MEIMPPETELALEQSQQGVSYEVSVRTNSFSMTGLEHFDNVLNTEELSFFMVSEVKRKIRVISLVFHSDNGNPSESTSNRSRIGIDASIRKDSNYLYTLSVLSAFETSEQVENGVVELYFIRTEYQLADVFTKPLAQEQMEFLIKKLGMQSMSPETLVERISHKKDEKPSKKQQNRTREKYF
ncbi:hypothetical protein Tco_0492236 [Tanacetum coccineum]